MIVDRTGPFAQAIRPPDREEKDPPWIQPPVPEPGTKPEQYLTPEYDAVIPTRPHTGNRPYPGLGGGRPMPRFRPTPFQSQMYQRMSQASRDRGIGSRGERAARMYFGRGVDRSSTLDRMRARQAGRQAPFTGALSRYRGYQIGPRQQRGGAKPAYDDRALAMQQMYNDQMQRYLSASQGAFSRANPFLQRMRQRYYGPPQYAGPAPDNGI